jgi:hypothetical protein
MCVIVFQNCNCVQRPGKPRERWLSDCPTAASIRVQTASGLLKTTLRNLALSVFNGD